MKEYSKKDVEVMQKFMEEDTRYNTPKKPHEVSEEVIDQAIADNEIYDEVRERILNTQRKQVGYGLAKYPETLNADTWNVGETIDHAIDEGIDQLHYLTMLKINWEQEVERNKKYREFYINHHKQSGEAFVYPEDILNEEPFDISTMVHNEAKLNIAKALDKELIENYTELNDKHGNKLTSFVTSLEEPNYKYPNVANSKAVKEMEESVSNYNAMSSLLADWVGSQIEKAVLSGGEPDLDSALSDRDKELLVDTFKKTSLYKELFVDEEDWNVEDNSGKKHKIVQDITINAPDNWNAEDLSEMLRTLYSKDIKGPAETHMEKSKEVVDHLMKGLNKSDNKVLEIHRPLGEGFSAFSEMIDDITNRHKIKGHWIEVSGLDAGTKAVQITRAVSFFEIEEFYKNDNIDGLHDYLVKIGFNDKLPFKFYRQNEYYMFFQEGDF